MLPLIEITVTARGESHIHHFNQGQFPIVVGRGGKCHLRIDELSVSRYHARVELREAQILFFDTASRNGTFLRGRRLSAYTPVPIDERPKSFVINNAAVLTLRMARAFLERLRSAGIFGRPPVSIYAEHKIALRDRYGFARNALELHARKRDETLADVRGALASVADPT